MRIIASLTFFLVAACTPSMQTPDSPSGIEFRVDPDVAAAGDSVTLELDNDSRETISYNLCSSALQHRLDEDWGDIPEARACTLELRILGPDENAEFRLQLPPTLEPGDYRYTTTIHLEQGGSAELLRSDTFTVR